LQILKYLVHRQNLQTMTVINWTYFFRSRTWYSRVYTKPRHTAHQQLFMLGSRSDIYWRHEHIKYYKQTSEASIYSCCQASHAIIYGIQQHGKKRKTTEIDNKATTKSICWGSWLPIYFADLFCRFLPPQNFWSKIEF
jgi:hypothetical protein